MRLVSVVIPTHNSATFIAEAVQSVRAQTYRNYEIIVVDDGSRDNTREVLEPFGDHITYLYQDNRGVAAARNAGIKLAEGELICLLDADDNWASNKLELQTAFMAEQPGVGLLFSDAEETEGTKIQKRSILSTMKFGAEALSQRPFKKAFSRLIEENFIPTSTVMIRKACLSTAGLFDEELQNAEDRDMWLRLAACSEVACLPEVLARKQSHGANISSRTEVALRSRIKVWDKARRQWPALAPAMVYQRMLAGAYEELGYIHLTRGESRAARQCGIARLRNALQYVRGTGSRHTDRWALSLGLVPLSLLPWPLVRSLWRARNYAFRRSAPATGATPAR